MNYKYAPEKKENSVTIKLSDTELERLMIVSNNTAKNKSKTIRFLIDNWYDNLVKMGVAKSN